MVIYNMSKPKSLNTEFTYFIKAQIMADSFLFTLGLLPFCTLLLQLLTIERVLNGQCNKKLHCKLPVRQQN